MKKLLLLLLPILLNAQHFTETFSSFLPDSTDANLQAFYIFDTAFSGVNDYSSNTFTLTANNNVLTDGSTANSPFISGGSIIDFTAASNHFFNVASFTPGNFGTGPVTIVGWERNTGSAGSYEWVSSKFTSFGANIGWDIGFLNTNAFFWGINTGGTQKTATKTGIRDSNWHYFAARRSGDNMSLHVDGGTPTTTTGVSAYNITNALDMKVGERASDGNFNWNGQIGYLAFYNIALSNKKIKELGYLASGWVSKRGEIARASASTFTQGINGSGLAVKVGAAGSYVSQALTASSVTYSMSLGAVNLSSDSIFIATNTDTISHVLSDSTLPAGYQWTLSIDGQETGGVVYVDNLSLTTSAIPATDDGQDKGFKEYKKYKTFKNWK